MNLYIGANGITHLARDTATSHHATHAHKLVVPLDAPIVLSTGTRAEDIMAPVFVPANVSQSMGSEGSTLALFWEPEHPLGRALNAASGSIHVIEGSAQRFVVGAIQEIVRTSRDPDTHATILDEVARILGAGTTPRVIDPRIVEAQEIIAARSGAISRGDIASEIGLSESRFSHLFTAQAGTSFQRYVLWTRTKHALREILSGASLTDAALVAGFSDHAHLTRTMRRFVGQPPSYVKTMI